MDRNRWESQAGNHERREWGERQVWSIISLMRSEHYQTGLVPAGVAFSPCSSALWTSMSQASRPDRRLNYTPHRLHGNSRSVLYVPDRHGSTAGRHWQTLERHATVRRVGGRWCRARAVVLSSYRSAHGLDRANGIEVARTLTDRSAHAVERSRTVDNIWRTIVGAPAAVTGRPVQADGWNPG